MDHFLKTIVFVSISFSACAVAGDRLPVCEMDAAYWTNCFGRRIFNNGNSYVGEWQYENFIGKGRYTYASTRQVYIGEWSSSKWNGRGSLFVDGKEFKSGIWKDGEFFQASPEVTAFVETIKQEINFEEAEWVESLDARKVTLARLAEQKKKEAEEDIRKKQERDNEEKAPLSRRQFLSLRNEMQELLRGKQFDLAEGKLDEHCPIKKLRTPACSYLSGTWYLEKGHSNKNSNEILSNAAFSFSVAFNGDNIEISTLAATALLPLLDVNGVDSKLAKSVLRHLAGSEFSSASQKRVAINRLDRIEIDENRRQKAGEAAAEKVQAEARKRITAEEEGRRNAEAKANDQFSGDGRLSLDGSKKKCGELGFKAGTEAFGKCVIQLSK